MQSGSYGSPVHCTVSMMGLSLGFSKASLTPSLAGKHPSPNEVATESASWNLRYANDAATNGIKLISKTFRVK